MSVCLYCIAVCVDQMAMAQNIQNGQSSEWALLRRHPSEDIFGVQLAGGHADYMGRTAKVRVGAGRGRTMLAYFVTSPSSIR